MLTEFGKALRKIRIDHQELIRDMAKNLSVSSAYLSAVENGKRKASASWIDTIATHYGLDKDQKNQLQEAYDSSVETIKLVLSESRPIQRTTAVSFAKALNGLSDEELEKIMRIVEKGSKRK